MALIKTGSMSQFAVAARQPLISQKTFLKGINTFSSLYEVSREIPADTFEFVTSSDQRGVALKSIRLSRGFEGFLQRLLNKTNEVYFIAWAFDLSGMPVNLYPGNNLSYQDVIIPIKSGKLREFIGQGINLFPKRQVVGGITIRIQLWESDQEIRTFGKAMADTADAIQKSKLNNLLSLISMATGVTGATITLIKEASIELTKVIGTILQANGNDYVDFFEGYYPSDSVWVAGNEVSKGNSAVLTLSKY